MVAQDTPNLANVYGNILDFGDLPRPESRNLSYTRMWFYVLEYGKYHFAPIEYAAFEDPQACTFDKRRLKTLLVPHCLETNPSNVANFTQTKAYIALEKFLAECGSAPSTSTVLYQWVYDDSEDDEPANPEVIAAIMTVIENACSPADRAVLKNLI